MSEDDNHNFGGQTGPAPSRRGAETADGFRKNGKARLVRLAREVIYQEEECPERVAQLKEAIEQGSYEIDSRKLADILIKEWFLKR